MNPNNAVGPVPVSGSQSSDGGSLAAAEMIRQKLNALYDTEPSASEEVENSLNVAKPLSRHQQFLKELVNTRATPKEIEQSWHSYYLALDDTGKHEVWREFYSNQKQARLNPHQAGATSTLAESSQSSPDFSSHVPSEETHKPVANPVRVIPAQQPFFSEELMVSHRPKQGTKNRKLKPDYATVADVKKRIVSTVNNRQKLKPKQHFQSLLFGLGIGSIVVIIFMFGFFNERFIAPFITPSRSVSNTPLIINASDTTVADPDPKVIIPKINVEIPVVYDEPSVEEKAVQTALERGVVHYATTPAPGEQGNVVIFGHSSNNIFNQGSYKFAFVLLSRLEVGDTFYLTKNNTRYTYQIYEKKIVKPDAVEVLGQTGRNDTATLITCDPPGTTLNRLVVIGEQVSPDPNVNVASSAVPADTSVTVVPSNAPSLWQRIKGWF